MEQRTKFLVQCEADKTVGQKFIEGLFSKMRKEPSNVSKGSRSKVRKQLPRQSSLVTTANKGGRRLTLQKRKSSTESYNKKLQQLKKSLADQVGRSRSSQQANKSQNEAASSSSSLVDQTDHPSRSANSRSVDKKKSIDAENALVQDADEREGGFGMSPQQESPTRKLMQHTTSMSLVNQNLSTTRQAIHKQIGGRIIQENEIKLAHTLEENTALLKALDKKLKEKEKIQYKHAKAQSNFIEIMRELTRFRREFNECHSLRSKLILTNSICKDVHKMVDYNEHTIREDEEVLKSFHDKKNRLFHRRRSTVKFVKQGQDSVSQRFFGVQALIKYCKDNCVFTKNAENIAKAHESKGQNLTKPLSGLKCVKISNISCFVQYKIDKALKTCHLKAFTRLRPGYIQTTLHNINVKTFNIDKQLENMELLVQAPWAGTMTEPEALVMIGTPKNDKQRLSQSFDGTITPKSDGVSHQGPHQQLCISEMEYFKGHLVLQPQNDPSVMFISNDEESLFYRVPRRILSFIDGCPSKVTHVEISFDEESERFIVCATEKEEDKDRFTISIPFERILSLVAGEGIRRSEESLLAIRSRQQVLIRAISTYLKRNVQIIEYDPSIQDDPNLMPTNFAAKQRNRSPSQKITQTGDQPLYQLFNNDGNHIRRPRMTLGLLSPEALVDHKGPAQARRRATNPSKLDSRNQPADLFAYQAHSSKIREKIEGHLIEWKAAQQRKTLRSNPTAKAGAQNSDTIDQAKQCQIDYTMQQIMRMVQDHSKLDLVQGLFINSVKNQPVYVQVVFNSDDETIMLLVITDFVKFELTQITTDTISHPLWQMIYRRFGCNNQLLMMKINTLLVSFEFHTFLQLIIDRQIVEEDLNISSKETMQSPKADPTQVIKFQKIGSFERRIETMKNKKNMANTAKMMKVRKSVTRVDSIDRKKSVRGSQSKSKSSSQNRSAERVKVFQ